MGATGIVVGCGSDGAPGQQGPAGSTGAAGGKGIGTTPEAAAGAIVPNAGILDREMDVVVTVDNTKLDATSAFDFGAGITVSNPQIVSPTTAFVHLKIDKAAATGSRDVKITASGKQLTSTKGFIVGGAVSVSVAEGTAEQGGYVLVDIQNRDHNAFNASGLKIESEKLAVDTPPVHHRDQRAARVPDHRPARAGRRHAAHAEQHRRHGQDGAHVPERGLAAQDDRTHADDADGGSGEDR